MNFSIAQIIARLWAPRHEISCSWFLWQRLCARLRERGRNATRESGAFLLGYRADGRARITDFILYDDLVATEVIELTRREARRMMVGKRGQRESCRQEDINELMIKLARQGKHVVRLKSGDPMIFGRAGEEIAELEKHGIEVTVVPGITAALAAASALGISLTHRDHAHSVRFVTGHARDGELSSDLDWRGLADPQTTVVFYMGGRTAPAIADRLMAEGLSAATPVVIMSGVSRQDGQRWCGILQDLAQGIGTIDRSQPVLIGIGQAFHIARQSQKLGAHPEPSTTSAAL